MVGLARSTSTVTVYTHTFGRSSSFRVKNRNKICFLSNRLKASLFQLASKPTANSPLFLCAILCLLHTSAKSCGSFPVRVPRLAQRLQADNDRILAVEHNARCFTVLGNTLSAHTNKSPFTSKERRSLKRTRTAALASKLTGENER